MAKRKKPVDIPSCDECGADLNPLAPAVNSDHLPECSLHPSNVMQLCQWFALCPNLAVTTQAHPVLGDVPICRRCKDWYDRMAPTP